MLGIADVAMYHENSLGTSVAASILFAGGIFILMAGGSIYSILKLNTAAQWVAHSEQVKAQVNGMFGLVVGWESANRGYVITGNEDYFAPYQDAAAELDARMAKLRMLVADNKAQMQRVEQLATLLQEKISIMNRSRAARAQTGFDGRSGDCGFGQGEADHG